MRACQIRLSHSLKDVPMPAFSRMFKCSVFRRNALSALLSAFFLILFLPLNSFGGPIQAKSAILYDLDRLEILYEQNADAKIPPASLTKILSMYVVFDAIEEGKVSLKDTVKVSRRAALEGGSRMGLRPGDKLTLERLLYGMAVASGNDASCAVAEHVYGSQAAFIKKMNSVGKKLGMQNSTFKTPHGLPAKGQYTTAHDMLNLARNYIARFPKALRYHSARSVTLHNRTSENKNPLLGSYKGADGLKTGWTTASGYNIITTARRGNTRLIAVLLGAPSAKVRAREIDRLMNGGFALRNGKASTVASYLGVKQNSSYASR